MRLPSDRILLMLLQFYDILNTVHSFHDGSLVRASFDQLGSYYSREIGRTGISKITRFVKFKFQDEPHETLEFGFGPSANFRLIGYNSWDEAILERR